MKSSTMQFIFILIIVNAFYSIGLLAVTNGMYYGDKSIISAMEKIEPITGNIDKKSVYAQYSDNQMDKLVDGGILNPVAEGQSDSLIEKLITLPKLMKQVIDLTFMSIFKQNVVVYGTELWELILVGIITTIIAFLNLLMFIAFFREVIIRIPI